MAATPPNIEYALLAEFDIDKGSTMRVQHPDSLPNIKADSLADLMLPDGASNQEWMCTMFFLNHRKQVSKTKAFADWEMVLCDYEEEGTQPAGAVAGGRLDRDEDKDSGKEKGKGQGDAGGGEEDLPPFYYCLNVVHTRKDATVRRGASIFALCVCSQYPFFTSWQQVIFHFLSIHRGGEDSAGLVESFYNAVNGMDISEALKRREACKDLARYASLNASIHNTQLLEWGGQHHRVSIPITQCSLDLLYPNVSVKRFVETFEKDVMTILHAVLKGESILFLGDSPDVVVLYVISCCALVSPPFSGILQSRVFPYVNFYNLEYRNIYGYIAGTINPTLAGQRGWHLLANITTGEVIREENYSAKQGGGNQIQIFGKSASASISKIASKLKKQPDVVFYLEVIERALELGCSERTLRGYFQRYCTHVVDVALGCQCNLDMEDEQAARRDAEYLNETITKLKDTAAFLTYVNELISGDRGDSDFDIGEFVREMEYYLKKDCRLSGPFMEAVVPAANRPPRIANSSVATSSSSSSTSAAGSSTSPAPAASDSSISSAQPSFVTASTPQSSSSATSSTTPAATTSFSAFSSAFQSLSARITNPQAPAPNAAIAAPSGASASGGAPGQGGAAAKPSMISAAPTVSPMNTKRIYHWRYEKHFERVVIKLCNAVQTEQQVYRLLIEMAKYNVDAEQVLGVLHRNVPLYVQMSALFDRLNEAKSKMFYGALN